MPGLGFAAPVRLLNLGIVAFVLVAVAALAIAGGLQVAMGPYGQFTVEAPTGEILAGARAGQTFTTDQPGLYRLDVYLGNYGRQIRGQIVLHVKAAAGGETDLATVSGDPSKVRADGFQAFVFQPLPLPAGTPLYFDLEAPGAEPGNALTALGSTRDTYMGGTAILEQLPVGQNIQDLAFRLYYKPSVGQAGRTVMARLTKDRPAVFSAPQLYVALLAIYLLGLAGLGVLVAASTDRARA